ncbi:hypothetical protein HXX76_007536 [Chlamydomonas incerta]|uniref:Uncharacterized protein n=1 Tax=Chlamydomonas incerta TaxID=51695 RepID=A0A835T046_CHLIN|nr:hypothetical protein HXX76_007536 [Chlamydomonas incerta]|eukprot:KAG2434642.1 hypothetical protein HXX76_007536 [Chlamydomonas incerta]
MTWDLSKLVLEGQSSPVSSAVVRQWLDLVYSRVDRERRPPQFSSLSEAARSLLLFADAVGTCCPVLDAFVDCLTAQPGLTLPVVVNGGAAGGDAGPGAAGGGGGAPPPARFELALHNHIYYVAGDMRGIEIPSGHRILLVAAAEFAPHMDAIPCAVASALEGWLYLSGRLGLVVLVRLLLQFYKRQLVAEGISVFAAGAATTAVFSRRVLECLPREVLVEGFLTGCMNDPAIGRADIASSSKLCVQLTSPESAAWFLKQPGAQVESELTRRNILQVDAMGLPMHLRLGGLPAATQQNAIREVLQQLDAE